MSKVNVYSAKGLKAAPLSLPAGFSQEGSPALLAQAIRVYEDRSHIGLAKAQTRAEVNRTKKKLYKQKGTGGARHGSRSAPIFVGGGKAHGPRPIEKTLLLPLKMRRKALAIALNLKLKEGKLVCVNDLTKLQKTNEAKVLVKKLGVKGKLTFILQEKGSNNKAFKNLAQTQTLIYSDLNAFQVYLGGTLIFDAGIFTSKNKKETKTK